MAKHPSSGSLGVVVRHLETQAMRGDPDRELLRRFADADDPAAFRVLVERHGPMVLGVCRRVLRCPHDAEDAFQATFLVLTQHAAAIRQADGLASWLHGVARRVATKLRRARQRRQRREQAVVGPAEYTTDEPSWAEVRTGLDEELGRLPPPYRDVLVLCYLEGLTRDEAAERLRVAVGAVKGRLERGRKLLADRLARRGLTLGAGLFAVALTPGLTSAAVEAAARVAAGEAVAAVASPVVSTLTHELLKGMAMTKLRLLGAGLLCAVALTVGGLAVQGQTGGPPAGKADFRPAVVAEAKDTDEAFIRRVSMDLRGVEPTPAEVHFFLANKDAKKRQTLVDLFVREREQKRGAEPWVERWAPVVRSVKSIRLGLDTLKRQIDEAKATIAATQKLIDELEAYHKKTGKTSPEDAQLLTRLRTELKAARDELARLTARYNEAAPARPAEEGPGPGTSADADPEVHRVNSRQFQVPVRVEPTRRGAVEEVQLFVSADAGKTWRLAETLRPDGDAFRYEAPADGVYWFDVRVVATDGSADPRDVSTVLPTLKVEVRTGGVEAEPAPRRD